MKAKSSNDKKSPLTASPLRNPGQSLDEKIQSLVEDTLSSYGTTLIFVIALTLMEWTRWGLNTPYSPIGFTLVCAVIVPICVVQIIKRKREIKFLKQGRDGERAVGQYLELLRESGCRVFHDIIGDGYNIDHVVVCEHGVFAVETKTYSKPSKGEARIERTESKLVINGATNTNIVIQARAEAISLTNIISESTGRRVNVKPVVLFPGWFVESKSNNDDVWVLNPKALPAFIQNSPKTLSRDEVMLFSYHISRYIRQT